MSGVATAIVGSSIISGVMGADAASSAADAQSESAANATAEQRRQFDLTRQDQQPYRDAGQNALSQILAGLQPGGEFRRNFTMADFQTDPGYQFRLSEGLKGVNNSAAARGGVLSGAAQKAIAQYNQNFASNEVNNAYNRFNTNRDAGFNKLASLSGIGQTATNQVDAAGQNMANNVSENMIGAGNARASGYVGGANAMGSGISGAINGYQGNRLMSLLQDRSNENFWGSPTYASASASGGYYPYGGAGLDVGNIS